MGPCNIGARLGYVGSILCLNVVQETGIWYMIRALMWCRAYDLEYMVYGIWELFPPWSI